MITVLGGDFCQDVQICRNCVAFMIIRSAVQRNIVNKALVRLADCAGSECCEAVGVCARVRVIILPRLFCKLAVSTSRSPEQQAKYRIGG
jgi:hypothetical protein